MNATPNAAGRTSMIRGRSVDHRKTIRTIRLSGVVAAVVATLALGVGAALAHVEPDPPAVEAGIEATVAFGVEHGCDGSPTTSLEFKIPDGVTDAGPVDKPGWTATVDGDVLRFSGGTLDAETADSFSISFTAPNAPGTIYFPVVQTCEAGDIAWIEIAAEGQPEPEHPAPAIRVTDGPPTSADLAPATDDEAAAEGSTDVSLTTATDGAVTDDSSSNSGVVIAILVGVVVLVGGGVAVVARRRSSHPAPSEGDRHE